jgi:hypothetical protein
VAVSYGTEYRITNDWNIKEVECFKGIAPVPRKIFSYGADQFENWTTSVKS